jgi:hypothetical protein
LCHPAKSLIRMQIEIKVDPAVNDLLLLAALVDQLTNVAAVSDPERAQALRRDIMARLKRMKQVTS